MKFMLLWLAGGEDGRRKALRPGSVAGSSLRSQTTIGGQPEGKDNRRARSASSPSPSGIIVGPVAQRGGFCLRLWRLRSSAPASHRVSADTMASNATTMNPDRFPGRIDNLNGAPATAHERARRRLAAQVEDPERHPDRLVLFSDASGTRHRLNNGQTDYRVGIAVAWQEKQDGSWIWCEDFETLDPGHFGPRFSDRAEFEAVAFGISNVARRLVNSGSYKSVVLYSDSDNALQWLKNPHYNGSFDTALGSLISLNSATREMGQRRISVELKWIPKSRNNDGIQGNIWADCWAHIATAHDPALEIYWERIDNIPDAHRHWHWFRTQMLNVQGFWPFGFIRRCRPSRRLRRTWS